MGGGTITSSGLLIESTGPSPRGRGNRSSAVGAIAGNGTIPAWAGEPAEEWHGVNLSRDHPRVGGGTATNKLHGYRCTGPSPRGRGNHHGGIFGDAEPGTIPAWAGEPSAFVVRFLKEGDHPRVGGGTARISAGRRANTGPSPRGRGNLKPLPEQRVGLGTIPAWAGEPIRTRCSRHVLMDHPRVGGGTMTTLALWVLLAGPSPRGRGNRSLGWAEGDR